MALNVKIERINEADAEIERMEREEVDMRRLYMQDGVIDDTERDALERVKGKIDQLKEIVARIRAEVEENQRIWESHAGDWTLAQNRLQELQNFRHPDAGAMAETQDTVHQAVTDQRWADATTAFEQVEYNMGPTWEDYERQVAARDTYDPMRVDFDTRMTDVAAAEPQTQEIVQRQNAIRGNVPAIDAAAGVPDYVQTLELMQVSVTELEALEAELMRVQQAQSAYDAALQGLQPRLTDASTSEYTALQAQSEAIAGLTTEMETLATAHDYEGALAKLQELSTAVDTFLADRDALDTARTSYEARLASLSGRLAAASSSEMESTANLQQTIIDAEDAMRAAAEAENFVEALSLADAVETALTNYEAVVADRDLYDARLAALQDELAQTSETRPEWAYLEPIQSEIVTIQTAMETAAAAEDFATALDEIARLEVKLLAFFDAIAAKRDTYQSARNPLEARLEHYTDCLYPLATEKAAVATALRDVDAAAAAEDWETAVNGVAGLEIALDAFDTAHDAHHVTLANQVMADIAPLRTAASDPANRGLTTTTTLTDNLVQITRSAGSDEHLIEVFDVIARSQALESQLANVRTIRDRIEGSWDEDGTAMTLYNEMQGDLANLPPEARNMLVENLLAEDGFFDSVDATERAAVQDIWSSAPNVDPAFMAADSETTSQIVAQLERDPEVQRIAAEWSGMSEAGQEAAMAHVASIIGGPEGWGLDGMDEMDYDVDGGDCTSNPNLKGSHTDTTINVCMCNNIAHAGWNPSADFADVVLNLTHEVGHEYQEQMVEEFNNGNMERSDPRYEQARMLALDRQYFEEFPADYDDFNIYVNSPWEQLSRRTSNRVQGELPGEFGAGNTERVN